ncbi:hypothetical protein Clacol_002492 [Clathrus columnatus]|uniref:Rieske domain-containing protein n=1 Tax=Clathrus columnatus TaxID=1419009 RepID=A0AAV5A0Y1_9AGAM|nr:hypothetical protein Clacol_002492 [Clathrus columnatus]
MSTITIPVLDENELQNGQMKEVDFGQGGKVLLSKLANKIHTTSAFCTHYGAPLAKGILVADGRVTCPWHGACFNICTGDIEDAPAPNAIHSFKAEVKDGKIYVTANQSDTLKENKSRFPTLRTNYITEGPGVVIVGGGAGALHAIESLREVLTVTTSRSLFSARRLMLPLTGGTRLSKALITDASKVEWRPLVELENKFGVLFRTGVELTTWIYAIQTVTGVITKSNQVIIDGEEKLAYEHLVLATGGTPRRLPIPGFDLQNVHTLRHVQDAQKIDANLQEGKRLVVIGSSFISMELVVAVSKRKLASIDVIALEDYPFERVLGVEIGKALKEFHESQGIKFHPSTKVNKIQASDVDPSLASGVEIEGGTFIPADVIVAGVGVVPATDFLKGSGIPLERDGSVTVDELLRVADLENVYALGDIATYPDKTLGEPRRIEHWNVASNHGRAIGRTIAGRGEPFNKIPVFWSAQGQQLRYTGNGVGFEDVIIKGKPSELKFVAYYTKGNKVIAVASMQADPLVMKCSELLRLGKMPSASEIRAGKVWALPTHSFKY